MATEYCETGEEMAIMSHVFLLPADTHLPCPFPTAIGLTNKL